MRHSRAGEHGRWGTATGGAVAITALIAWCLGAPLPNRETAEASVPKAGLVFSTTAALNEQALMHDTTPLFLPTERNANIPDLPRREPGKSLLDHETLKLSFGDDSLNLVEALPPAVTLNGKAADEAKSQDVLTTDLAGRMMLGFGRTEKPFARLPERGGFMEIVAAGSGMRILAETVPIAFAPPTLKEWQPLQFLAAVDATGLIGPLTLVEGSRVEEVDAYFRTFLPETLRIGARLPPGFYRITIGP